MIQPKLVGPKAGAIKYDVLTALNLIGLHGAPVDQVSMQRLSTLITARYNWRREELSIGQRDMARMLCVTERTIKREVKRWTDRKVLICTRAGVRGRVAAFRLSLIDVYAQSEPFWSAVGPDYVARMTELAPSKSQTVVPFSKPAATTDEIPQTTAWGSMCQRLNNSYPEKTANWLKQLAFVSDDGQHFVVEATSGFAARYIETHLGREIAEAIEAEVGLGRRLVILDAGKRSHKAPN